MKEGIFMLFQKKTPEEKMEKLVHKKEWSRLTDYVYGDLQEILLKLPAEKEPLKQEISSTIQLLHKKL